MTGGVAVDSDHVARAGRVALLGTGPILLLNLLSSSPWQRHLRSRGTSYTTRGDAIRLVSKPHRLVVVSCAPRDAGISVEMVAG